MKEVTAITVTYNTMKTLVKTIDALLSQTYPVSKIIITDNNSNEENKAQLRELEKKYDKITVIWSKDNTGGAGGFYQGMKYARENLKPDWYWLMDDDAYPEPDCLEQLMSHSDMENVGCLAPLIYGINYNDYQIYHHKKITPILFRDKTVIRESVEALDELTSMDADAFVGPLFSSKAVETVGIADGLLFIYGDDLEYTYRVSRKFETYLVKKAVINHLDIPMSGKNRSVQTWWKDYYKYRNLCLFVNEFKTSSFNAFMAYLYIIWGMVRSTVRCCLVKETRKFWKLRLKLMRRAFFDGISGRKGKRIDPAKFIKMVNRV